MIEIKAMWIKWALYGILGVALGDAGLYLFDRPMLYLGIMLIVSGIDILSKIEAE